MVVQQARFQPPLVYLEVMHSSWVYSEAGFLVVTDMPQVQETTKF